MRKNIYLLFMLLFFFTKAIGQRYVDYCAEKVKETIQFEMSQNYKREEVNIISISDVYADKEGQYKESFCAHFQFYYVRVSTSDSLVSDYIIAINSAKTIYRISGFLMNDIMSLCTDIQKEVYYYCNKKIRLAKELKKMHLDIIVDDVWLSFSLYDLYEGCRECSFDYKKYPLLKPSSERAIGYVIGKCCYPYMRVHKHERKRK